MPPSERTLLQIRISESEKRQIKMLAASQGVTLHKALIEAFAAWAEKLKATKPTAKSRTPQARVPGASDRRSAAPQRSTRRRAPQLDWTRCPEVEVVQSRNRRFLMVRGTLAPLQKVLQAIADGHPLKEIAEVFQVETPRLQKLIEFARSGGQPVTR